MFKSYVEVNIHFTEFKVQVSSADDTIVSNISFN